MTKMTKVLEHVANGDLSEADRILGEMMLEFAQAEYQAMGPIEEPQGFDAPEDDLSVASADLTAEPEVALEPTTVEPAIAAPVEPDMDDIDGPVALDAPMDMDAPEDSTQELADLQTDLASLMRRYQDLLSTMGAEDEIEPAAIETEPGMDDVSVPALPMDGSEVEVPMASVSAPEDDLDGSAIGAEPETMLDDIGESLSEEQIQTVGDGDKVDVNTSSPVVSHPVGDRMDRAGDSHKAHPGTKGYNPETPPTVKQPNKKPPTLSPVKV